ncbi:cortex morphogenetic protein CmpA [Priestia megaterium]
MWLQKQMRRAYSEKDRAQIKLLTMLVFFIKK